MVRVVRVGKHKIVRDKANCSQRVTQFHWYLIHRMPTGGLCTLIGVAGVLRMRVLFWSDTA